MRAAALAGVSRRRSAPVTTKRDPGCRLGERQKARVHLLQRLACVASDGHSPLAAATVSIEAYAGVDHTRGRECSNAKLSEDELVHPARLLHLRHMAGPGDDHRLRAFESVRVSRRNDAIVLAPNDEDRPVECAQAYLA